MRDLALAFDCDGDRLYGVASVPAAPAERGVLIVVGGPQYRAGSHRQFTLLARALAGQGIAAMRFDVRGMGDSEGSARPFEDIGADLDAAVTAFMQNVPTLREVVLWGLCDGASAAALYAARDARVKGLALLNPWVRTEAGAATATIKHYYRARLFDRTFWQKLASGKFDAGAAVRSAVQLAKTALAPAPASSTAVLPDQVYLGLVNFDGRLLVMLSGADLTAQEFQDASAATDGWRALMAQPRVTRHVLDGADHTCSRRDWHDQIAAWT
ncbi:MAG TPA: hydrolase 1, exosortase A system-associated, partial [Telluria sp.]